MKIEVQSRDVLEIAFEDFKIFYPLFNSGEKVLWYKEKEDRFLLLAFIDTAPTFCQVLKQDIIDLANAPDAYPETTDRIIEEWRQEFLISQAPQQWARPFIRFGDIE